MMLITIAKSIYLANLSLSYAATLRSGLQYLELVARNLIRPRKVLALIFMELWAENKEECPSIAANFVVLGTEKKSQSL